MGRRRHPPQRLAVRAHHRTAQLVKRVIREPGDVLENSLGNVAPRGLRSRIHPAPPLGLWWRVCIQPFNILGQRIHRRRPVCRPATRHRCPHRYSVADPNAPLIDRQSIGQAHVSHSGYRQPRICKPPSQRRRLFAIVQMPIHLLAIYFSARKERGDILIRRPVQRHTQFIAILPLELALQIRTREPIVPEPVQVGELLVRQLQLPTVIVLAKLQVQKVAQV